MKKILRTDQSEFYAVLYKRELSVQYCDNFLKNLSKPSVLSERLGMMKCDVKSEQL